MNPVLRLHPQPCGIRVLFNRAGGHAQREADLLCGRAASEKADDISLARCQGAGHAASATQASLVECVEDPEVTAERRGDADTGIFPLLIVLGPGAGWSVPLVRFAKGGGAPVLPEGAPPRTGMLDAARATPRRSANSSRAGTRHEGTYPERFQL